MRLLVQVSTENRNNADNPPGEAIINQLPANETVLTTTNDTEVQSTRSESDSINSDFGDNIKKEDKVLETEEEVKGYKSDSTAWSDKPENWWPSDPHHYYFEIKFEDFGIFVGDYGDTLRFVHKFNTDKETNNIG
jgi:hypothetical protein